MRLAPCTLGALPSYESLSERLPFLVSTPEMYPSANNTLATAALRLEYGICTCSLLTLEAFVIRMSMSAIGSVILVTCGEHSRTTKRTCGCRGLGPRLPPRGSRRGTYQSHA